MEASAFSVKVSLGLSDFAFILILLIIEGLDLNGNPMYCGSAYSKGENHLSMKCFHFVNCNWKSTSPTVEYRENAAASQSPFLIYPRNPYVVGGKTLKYKFLTF